MRLTDRSRQRRWTHAVRKAALARKQAAKRKDGKGKARRMAAHGDS